MTPNETTQGWRARLAKWFPDREFFMRSQGKVRFITITSRMQKIAALAVVAALIIWALTVAAAAWFQYFSINADRQALLEREAKVASASERVDKYADDVKKVADDLSKRQDFVESVIGSLPEDIKKGETVSDSRDEAAKTISKVSALIPEAAPLARLEARQLEMVEKLTRFADRRANRAAIAIRKLGLNPNTMLKSTGKNAVGGPFELLSTSKDKTIDPRFERLGLSVSRMKILERGLAGIPQFSPASANSISSGFGYRRDPFNGRGARHSGLDFRGPYGTPIYAAAQGTVSFSGWKSGYW